MTWMLAELPESLATKCYSSRIFRIVSEQADSIQHFDGEKLYLKAENIRHANGKQFLYNDNSVIFLPTLSVNEQGFHYILCRSSDDVKLVCSNPDCSYEWWFTDEWSAYCPICDSIGN